MNLSILGWRIPYRTNIDLCSQTIFTTLNTYGSSYIMGIAAILHLPLLSAILKFENNFIKVLFKHSINNTNANLYVLIHVIKRQTKCPIIMKDRHIGFDCTGRHLGNRTWTHQHNDKAYSIEPIQ